MQSEKIPSAILNAAALLLQPYLPDLTPQKLETALMRQNSGRFGQFRPPLHSEWLFAGDQYQSPSGAN